DPLRTLADRFRGCETLRTHIDPRMLRAAVMAQERARPAMHGQMRIASFAMSGPAATRAKEHRRIAPAIQEQHDLSAGVEVPVHGEQRRRRNALRLCVPAQVDERPPRRLSPRGGAFRKSGEPFRFLARTVERLERRRRRPEYDRNVIALRTHDREIACRIAKAFVLLE